MKDTTSSEFDEGGEKTRLTLQLGERDCVKIHVTLKKRSFQVHSAPYLGRREHAWIIRCLNMSHKLTYKLDFLAEFF